MITALTIVRNLRVRASPKALVRSVLGDPQYIRKNLLASFVEPE